MTTRFDPDRSLSAWFRESAATATPDYLDEIVERVARAPQRAWWSSPGRWLPMDMTFTGRLVTTFRPALALLLVALLLAAVGVAILAGSQRRLPAPFGPAANGLIVFSSARGTYEGLVEGDIMAMDPNGKNLRTLVGGRANDVNFQLSNDGTRLLITRRVAEDEIQLLISDVDSAGIRAITRPYNSYGSGAWLSPDNSRVLLIQEQQPGGPATLSTIAADGSGERKNLALNEGATSLDVEWAWWLPPDGREIGFLGTTEDEISLYAVRPDGTGLRRMTPPGAIDMTSFDTVSLAPDGTRLAFSTRVEVPSPRSEVHVLNLVTGEDVRISNDPNYAFDTGPTFSPDGTSILFSRHGEYRAAKLMIVASDGSGAARQVGPDSGGYAGGADFSPDGKRLLVGHGSGIWKGIEVIDIATGTVDVVSEVGRSPTWQRVAP